MKRTITPWFANGNIIRADGTGACVALCATKDTSLEESNANAAFIVKCANECDVLLAALEKFVHAAIEKHQDIYVADEVIKDPSYLKKYASDYDFAWPQHIYDGVAALAAAKGAA